MNREIKFRAWDLDGKQFLKGDFSMGIESGEFRGKYGEVFENVEIMQFTGLKDKNGQDIFDGDIVKTYYHLFDNDTSEHIGKVYFQEFRLSWSVKYSGFVNQDLYVYSRPDCYVEIIGNIYENPELLN